MCVPALQLDVLTLPEQLLAVADLCSTNLPPLTLLAGPFLGDVWRSTQEGYPATSEGYPSDPTTMIRSC